MRALNSMSVLDDKKRLGLGRFRQLPVWLRIAITNRNASESTIMRELEVPYIGLVPARRQDLSRTRFITIKAGARKEYYYHATVILRLIESAKNRVGKVYVYGAVKGQGPQEIPPDEILHRQ